MSVANRNTRRMEGGQFLPRFWGGAFLCRRVIPSIAALPHAVARSVMSKPNHAAKGGNWQNFPKVRNTVSQR